MYLNESEHRVKLEKECVTLAQEAQKLNATISYVSFKHENVGMAKLMTITKNTGGQLFQISIDSGLSG